MTHHQAHVSRGRGPPAPPDDDRARVVAGWQATHRLTAPDVRWLTVYAAAAGITFDAALLELRVIASVLPERHGERGAER